MNEQATPKFAADWWKQRTETERAELIEKIITLRPNWSRATLEAEGAKSGNASLHGAIIAIRQYDSAAAFYAPIEERMAR